MAIVMILFLPLWIALCVLAFALAREVLDVHTHDWRAWEEVQGLSIRISDEFGACKRKDYRRFERYCRTCGKPQLKKLRSA